MVFVFINENLPGAAIERQQDPFVGAGGFGTGELDVRADIIGGAAHSHAAAQVSELGRGYGREESRYCDDDEHFDQSKTAPAAGRWAGKARKKYLFCGKSHVSSHTRM